MDESHFDWDDLRLFLSVARRGGLGPAAADTGKSPPTLGRRMLALERRLGLELFERLPRGYALTDQGRELLARAVELESRIAPLTDPRGAARPVLKISAGSWVTHLLCRRISALTADEAVTLRFISADHVLDIARREAVIGIRNLRPEQPGLAYRRTGRVKFAVYAANGDIANWARVLGSTPSAQWAKQHMGAAPAIEVTHPRSALDLALAGAARAVLPTFIGDAQTSLRRLGPLIDELEHEQWLVTHHEDRFLPHVHRVGGRIHAMLKTALA